MCCGTASENLNTGWLHTERHHTVNYGERTIRPMRVGRLFAAAASAAIGIGIMLHLRSTFHYTVCFIMSSNHHPASCSEFLPFEI